MHQQVEAEIDIVGVGEIAKSCSLACVAEVRAPIDNPAPRRRCSFFLVQPLPAREKEKCLTRIET